ncbi:hypothetical protein AB0939_22995 [Streptomyces sp. NPDC006990]|uniref:hypothetical protein n=1 Tax=unclassified Streptomyces TaxID=2593676 RepID=UPI0034569263
MSGADHELRKELDATLQTRRELGPEYENELLDSFLEKVEQRLDTVVDKRVRRRMAEEQMVAARGSGVGAAPQPRPASGLPDGLGARLGLAVASLVLAIPLSAIAVANAGLTGLVTCWAGIVAVNGLQASRSWFSRGGSTQTSDLD